MDVTTLLPVLGVLGALVGAAVLGHQIGQQQPTPVRVPVPTRRPKQRK